MATHRAPNSPFAYDTATATFTHTPSGEQLAVQPSDRWISTPCYVCDAEVTHRLERADGIERLPAVCHTCETTAHGTAMLLEAIRFDRARLAPITPAERAGKTYRKPAETVMCLRCATPVEQHPDGRPRLYCSARCRVAAHRSAKRAKAAKARPAAPTDGRLSDAAIERTLARIGRRPHQSAERGWDVTDAPLEPEVDELPAPRRTIALISCSSEKLDHAAPARDLYTSALFRKSVKYAEEVAEVDGWYVLSARHGLVRPDEILEPYDEKLTAMPRKVHGTTVPAAWGTRVGLQLLEEFTYEELQETVFVVLAGGAYAANLEACNMFRLEQPLEGLQIGERLAWLPAL